MYSDSYDDDEEYIMFKRFLHKNKVWRNFISEYIMKENPRLVDLDIEYQFEIKRHGLGKYDVDVVLLDDQNISTTLIELETSYKWCEQKWPTNYQYGTFVQRKVKYVREEFGYIHCIFSKEKNLMYVFTKDNVWEPCFARKDDVEYFKYYNNRMHTGAVKGGGQYQMPLSDMWLFSLDPARTKAYFPSKHIEAGKIPKVIDGTQVVAYD